MKLEAVSIQNFRSIQEVNLKDCGGFNVIVGKNNAGKSNILLAINAFFKSLAKGEPVVLNPLIGEPIDYHENHKETSIKITMFLQPSLTDMKELIQDIVSEAPQVKNSVEEINSELRLALLFNISAFPKVFGYIQKIVLCKPGCSAISEQSIVRTLLEINVEAAEELVNKAERLRDLGDEIEQIKELVSGLNRLDEDDWERITKNLNPITFSERLFLFLPMRAHRSRTPSPNLSERLQKIIQETNSKSEFSNATSSLLDNMREEIISLRSEPIQNRINSFSGQETSVPQYVLNLIQKVGEMNILYLTERREPIGKREAAKLLELKVTRGGPEKLRAIQETVSALLGVDIDAFRANKAPSGEEPEAELDVDQFLVQVNGAGIREALRLILDYELNRPNILLVEEPEIHLHPALETSMMRYLKTIGKDCQIFITTHSTNFLDTADMRNVYLASRDTSTTIQLINVEEAEQNIPRELGIRLSSLFMFDRLIFVEGPTDEDVIREWASTCNINLAQASVGFVPMGGVRNLAHFATEAVINFLGKRRVLVFFVLDRDEREKDEVKHLSDQLGDRAQLIVLEKRELENYLLCPRAIAEFIELKYKLAGTANSQSIDLTKVETEIEKCADELKNIAVERRVVRIACSPIYPDRNAVLNPDSDLSFIDRLQSEYENQINQLVQSKNDIEKIIKEQNELVESNWTTEKRNLVPGDLLLDKLCKSFGVRFNKARDSSRLASLMKEDEIDHEIKNILKRFVETLSRDI